MIELLSIFLIKYYLIYFYQTLAAFAPAKAATSLTSVFCGLAYLLVRKALITRKKGNLEYNCDYKKLFYSYLKVINM